MHESKIKEINSQENSNKQNISDLWRGINKFKTGYQPGNNLLKDKNVNLLARSHDIPKHVKNHLC